MFCVWRMSTVTILGNCLLWLMSGSGKDSRWNLITPPRCVLVCVCVCVFLCRSCTFFWVGGGRGVKISTGQGTYGTLLILHRLCLSQHKEGGKDIYCLISPYLTFLCPLLATPVSKRVQRSRTASPQCQQKGSSPESHRNGTGPTTREKKLQQKEGCQMFTGHWDSLVSCTNFLL